MLLTLFKLRFLKAVRSVSLGRRLIGGFFLALIGFILLSNLLFMGFWLKDLIDLATDGQSALNVINTYLIFYFSAEILYRFFLQKASAIELEQYLHLPIGRSTIIHFLLSSSFISALNIIPLLLFGPYAINELSVRYGTLSAVCWVITVAGISWALHWLVLWFKQKYGDSIAAILSLFVLLLSGIFLAYYDIFNIGTILSPFFEASLGSLLPPAMTIIMLGLSYYLAYAYYQQHAYLEELDSKRDGRRMQRSVPLFNRFGLAGKVADLELKLILRNKRSRRFLVGSFAFLLYGLLFYTDESIVSGDSISFFTVFIGIFITGMFSINYGELFLSWNSEHLDFYLTKNEGLKALITGKYILFFAITLCFFLLSIPYAYFGWKILLINGVAFLFNVGVNVHIIIALALWKPKPIDINQGGMFNYEGIGAAQFLMVIPVFLLPYLIYLPFSWWGNSITGIIVLGLIGILGIIFNRQLIDLHINRLLKNKYNIGASFRREL